MTLEEVLSIMQNRLISLSTARTSAFNSGDISKLVEIDADLLSTRITIQQLKSTIEAMNTLLSGV